MLKLKIVRWTQHFWDSLFKIIRKIDKIWIENSNFGDKSSIFLERKSKFQDKISNLWDKDQCLRKKLFFIYKSQKF